MSNFEEINDIDAKQHRGFASFSVNQQLETFFKRLKFIDFFLGNDC